MLIPLNDFRRQWMDLREDATAAFQAVGESGWYILGEEVRLFEAALANLWELPHAAGVASGLDALEIALKTLGCGPGEHVLTTPLSAFATTLAILRTGAKPVFADTDNNGLIDLDLCRRTLLDRPDVRFFVPVHLYGHPVDASGLRAILTEFDVAMVEDCAQSIGAGAGTTGHAAATSFYPTKNLGAMGDGGALLTRDERIAAAARELRDYGQRAKYVHASAGYNSRLDELQAALLRRVMLPRLADWTARRRQTARSYLDGIRNPLVRTMEAPGSVWHLFPILCENKRSLMDHLRARGVSSGEHYPVAIPDQPAMAGCEFPGLENARRICRYEVSLPIHPYLEPAEVNTVIQAVNEWHV